MAGKVEREPEAPNPLVEPTLAPSGTQPAHFRR